MNADLFILEYKWCDSSEHSPLLPPGAVEVDQSILELPGGVEGLAEDVDGRQGDGVHAERRPGVLDGGLVLTEMEVTPFLWIRVHDSEMYYLLLALRPVSSSQASTALSR